LIEAAGPRGAGDKGQDPSIAGCRHPLPHPANATCSPLFLNQQPPPPPLPFRQIALQVVASIQPDGFTPTIITRTNDYLYAEFEVRPWGCPGGGGLYMHVRQLCVCPRVQGEAGGAVCTPLPG
jgi:hypothetical protein